MIGLITAASTVLGSLGGGGSPLGSITGTEAGPVTSAAEAHAEQTASTGSFQVGGETPWLALALIAVLVILVIKET